MNLTFSQWILSFTLYSILGWICETIWCSIGARRFVNRGFLAGPWCPIYGFGACIILLVVYPLQPYPLLVFLLSMLFTSMLEYFTGWLLESLFKTRWWDYRERRFNLKGRVCLRNSLIFGALGLVVVDTWHLAEGLLVSLSPTRVRVLASLVVVVFLSDLLWSLGAAANLEIRLRGIRAALEEMERYQQTYSWFDRKDLTGSIQRLREICAEEPDNAVAADILLQLNVQFKHQGSNRLARAFPQLLPQEYKDEFAALKAQWELLRLEQKNQLAARRERWSAWRRQLREDYRIKNRDISLSRMVWVFLIACVIGFVVETIFCLVTTGTIESRQGLIYGPFSHVYGFGAVLLVIMLEPLTKRGKAGVFIGGAIVGGLFEAACSLFSEAVWGSVSWEYSHRPFSLFGGRTNLLYMFFWGVLSVAYICYIYPKMVERINSIAPRAKNFFTIAIAVLLTADMALSAVAVGRWSDRLSNIPAQNSVDVWLDENYPDEMLEEIYPNMMFLNLPEDEPDDTTEAYSTAATAFTLGVGDGYNVVESLQGTDLNTIIDDITLQGGIL